MIAGRLLVVADAHQSSKPVGMPRHRLRDLVVGRVPGTSLHQGQCDAVLIHIGDQVVGVVNRWLGKAAL